MTQPELMHALSLRPLPPGHAPLVFPTRKDEEWRFIRLNGLYEAPLVSPNRSLAGELPIDATALAAWHVAEAAGRSVVMVDGVFRADLSDLSGLGVGLTVEIITPDDALNVEGFGELGALIQGGHDAFVALNGVAWEQAVRVDVARDVSAQPLHLLFLESGAQRAVVTPRVWLRACAGSRVTIIEEHRSLNHDAPGALGVPLVEVSLGENARVDHIKIQGVSAQSWHVARQAVWLGRGAHFASVTYQLGAALSRQELHAEIASENTTCELHGLTLITGDQESDTHSVMNHCSPHAHSNQVHKCVMGGRAHAVFNGKIFVQPGAQQIDAFQLNRNLLLSDRARVDTKPQLEILADDVKCSHGATIGQLDDEQLFYLQARGLAADAARALLTYAFAGELVERAVVRSVRERLEREVLVKTQPCG